MDLLHAYVLSAYASANCMLADMLLAEVSVPLVLLYITVKFPLNQNVLRLVEVIDAYYRV